MHRLNWLSTRLSETALLVAALLTNGQAARADDRVEWWNADWVRRAEVRLPESTETLVRVPIPEGATPSSLRCVLAGTSPPLPHWTQTIDMDEPVRLPSGPRGHFGFPRIVRAANGDILLFYRVGSSHASDHSSIGMQRSTDGGTTWSEQRLLWQDEEGFSAHNPVALVTRDGRVILWASRYQYAANKTAPQKKPKQPCSWAHSDDHGQTWSPFEFFDPSAERNSYYITDAIQTDEGLLAGAATFPPTGAEPCYDLMWHSNDDGRTWKVCSTLTQPAENLGDEVGLLQTAPGRVLCLLRDRRGKDIYRLWSADNGKTWSERERLREMFGCVFQRPFLTRLDSQTVLASGRDRDKRQVVAYVSRDNCQTFGERHVLESYKADGAYTAAVEVGPGKVLMTWYTDEAKSAGRPDLKLATLTVNASPKWLWMRIPQERDRDARLFVYFGNEGAQIAEDRREALLRPSSSAVATWGKTEQASSVTKR